MLSESEPYITTLHSLSACLQIAAFVRIIRNHIVDVKVGLSQILKSKSTYVQVSMQVSKHWTLLVVLEGLSASPALLVGTLLYITHSIYRSSLVTWVIPASLWEAYPSHIRDTFSTLTPDSWATPPLMVTADLWPPLLLPQIAI